jgi:ribosomal protein L19E
MWRIFLTFPETYSKQSVADEIAVLKRQPELSCKPCGKRQVQIKPKPDHRLEECFSKKTIRTLKKAGYKIDIQRLSDKPKETA